MIQTPSNSFATNGSGEWTIGIVNRQRFIVKLTGLNLVKPCFQEVLAQIISSFPDILLLLCLLEPDSTSSQQIGFPLDRLNVYDSGYFRVGLLAAIKSVPKRKRNFITAVSLLHFKLASLKSHPHY